MVYSEVHRWSISGLHSGTLRAYWGLSNTPAFAQERDIVKVVDGVVCLHEPKERVDLTKYVEKHQFRFDEAFDETKTNVDVSLLSLFLL